MSTLIDRIDGATIGLEMGGCIAVGYFLGTWLDGRFDIAPWGLVFGLIVGGGAAIKAIVRVYRKARRQLATPHDPTIELQSRSAA